MKTIHIVHISVRLIWGLEDCLGGGAIVLFVPAPQVAPGFAGGSPNHAFHFFLLLNTQFSPSVPDVSLSMHTSLPQPSFFLLPSCLSYWVKLEEI